MSGGHPVFGVGNDESAIHDVQSGARLGPRYVQLLAVAAGIVAADQATKAIVVDRLGGGRIVRLLGGTVWIEYARNHGAAFSVWQNGSFVFAAVAIAVVGSMVVYRARIVGSPLLTRIALGFVLGGALGNLVDRIRLGYVVDFIDLRWWPVFNLADSAVVVGAVILAALSVHEQPKRRGA